MDGISLSHTLYNSLLIFPKLASAATLNELNSYQMREKFETDLSCRNLLNSFVLGVMASARCVWEYFRLACVYEVRYFVIIVPLRLCLG